MSGMGGTKVKKVLWVMALTLALAFPFVGTAMAQELRYGIEVCVIASNEAEARRLFANTSFHVLPDFADSELNGWRIIEGTVPSVRHGH